jgi:hypothetical protein
VISDTDLADELIGRLNKLLEDPTIQGDISALVETRIACSNATNSHSTIQASSNKIGFLGLLNGVVGTIPEGKRKGWGYITAECEGEDPNPSVIKQFKRTKED